MRYQLFFFLIATLSLSSMADTIDFWCISHNDTCLIQANQNSFNEGQEVICIQEEDRNKKYVVYYSRDVGYETKRKLHFYNNGVKFYTIFFREEYNRTPIEFKLEKVLNNLSVLDSGAVIKIYYSEQNEHFSEDEIYIGEIHTLEDIGGRREESYDRWFKAATITILSIIILIVLVIRRKNKS